MLEYIKGTLAESSPFKVIIEAGGLGYGIFIPLNTYPKLPQIGAPVSLFLSEVIREDAHKLYGFLKRSEKVLFEKVTEVSGIGPKMGLSLIGHMEIDELEFAVASGNVAVLSKAPGIGKKTAERLIVELKDKIKTLSEPLIKEASQESSIISDAIGALVQLGYNPLLAQKAVKTALTNASQEPKLPELITSALRSL